MSLDVTLSRRETIRGVNRCQNLKKGHLESAASLWLFLGRNKYSDHTLQLPFFQSLAKEVLIDEVDLVDTKRHRNLLI